MNEDNDLLRRYAGEGSQEAFAELVRRKVDLVFAAALRQTGGNAHLAQDVTQAVFIALAARARSLAGHAVLTGWLFTTTRFLAIHAMREQRRWQRREQEANAMTHQTRCGEPAWDELRPVIDEALHEIGEKDRAVLLLRFFEGRSLSEVGVAIGLAENSARMRVERALEKLRGRLARRGITSTAAALGGTLAAQPAVAAPVGLVAHVARASLAGGLSSGAGVTAVLATLNLVNKTKFTFAMCSLLAAVGVGAYFGARWSITSPPDAAAGGTKTVDSAQSALWKENRRLQTEIQRLSKLEPSRAEGQAMMADDDRRNVAIPAWQVLANLQQSKLASPAITFLGGSGRLTEAFSTLFALTGAERVMLQQALDQACARLTDLQRQNATITSGEKGKVSITIQSFAAAGGTVYNEVMSAFAQTLGRERNAAFVTLGGEQVERALGRFGLPEWTYTFSVRENVQGRAYSVEEGYRLPQSHGRGTLGFRTFEEMEDRLGPVVRLLPGDFARLPEPGRAAGER